MPELRRVSLLPSPAAEAIAAPPIPAPAPAPPATPSRPAGRPPTPGHPARSVSRRPRRWRASAPGRFYPILTGAALLIAALSLLTPSTPSYDPWAWLVWGREILHLQLHTTAGPSFKPLPVLFTTALAPFGSAAPDLWLVVARAGALIAAVLCFRFAWRLARRMPVAPTGLDPARGWGRLPAALAGLIAAGTFVNSPEVFTGNSLGYSEGLMVALVLIALERHLEGAPLQGFVIGFFACLDRPELWLVWFPYGLYLWRSRPGARRLIAALLVLFPALWFLPELWGSGQLLRSITRAQAPRPNSSAYASCPFCSELVRHAWPAALPQVEVAALVAMVAAAGSRCRRLGHRWASNRQTPASNRQTPDANRQTPDANRQSPASNRLSPASNRQTPDANRLDGLRLALAVGALGFSWWIGVAIETQLHFSGNNRYLELGTALVAVAGGVAWGWAAGAAGRVLNRPWAGTALALGAFLAIPPWIAGRGVIIIPAAQRALVYQARLRQDLTSAVAALGGPARILRCGTVMTEGFQVPMLAWTLGVHTVQVQAPPASPARPGPAPNVIFQTRATRSAALLPVVSAWRAAGYRLVAHVRTFSVYSSCRDRVRR